MTGIANVLGAGGESQMKPIIASPTASVARRPPCSKRRVPQSRSAAAAVLIAMHMVSFVGSPLAAQTPADIAQAAGDIPRSLDLQTELPSSGWPEWLLRLLLWLLVGLNYEIVGLAIVGTLVLAYCLYKVLPAFGVPRRPQWENAADGSAIAAGSGDAAARAAADELAAQGRFVEAMHVLLLQGLDELRMRLNLRFADCLTSREIISRADAPAGAKAALRDIIRLVEHAYFGHHPVDHTDYDRCRCSYLTLDDILRAGGRK
jgi:Domain of unknown function (DUF4129)